MTFKGTVRGRSSADRQPEVAGEAEIFRQNPNRTCRIMEETDWETVFKGTLNLVVCEGVFEQMRDDMCPLFFEHPNDVRHPTNPQIPTLRLGYYYYSETASMGGKKQEVLVRRAGNPHDKRSVELIAPVKLIDYLRIKEGDEIEVTLVQLQA